MTGKPALNPKQQSVFNDALNKGIGKKDMDMITLALKNGAEPNILLFAGIDYKLSKGEKFWGYNLDWGLKLVKLAHEYGADVMAQKNDFKNRPWMALFWVQDNFSREIADFLISKGAKVDALSPLGATPLMEAVTKGDAGQVEYFLAKGGDPLQSCGAKKEFPLQVLQQSGKFKESVRDRLVKQMMQVSAPKPAPEEPPKQDAVPPAPPTATITDPAAALREVFAPAAQPASPPAPAPAVSPPAPEQNNQPAPEAKPGKRFSI